MSGTKHGKKYWIKKLNTLQPNGYNINTGGDGGDNLSCNPRRDEIRAKISDGLKFNYFLHPELAYEHSLKISGKRNGRYIDGGKAKRARSEKRRRLKESKLSRTLNMLPKLATDKLTWSEIRDKIGVSGRMIKRVRKELQLDKPTKPTSKAVRKAQGLKIRGLNNGRWVPEYHVKLTKRQQNCILSCFFDKLYHLHEIAEHTGFTLPVIRKCLSDNGVNPKKQKRRNGHKSYIRRTA